MVISLNRRLKLYLYGILNPHCNWTKSIKKNPTKLLSINALFQEEKHLNYNLKPKNLNNFKKSHKQKQLIRIKIVPIYS